MSIISRILGIFNSVSNLIINSNNISEEFITLTLDESLEKIINESTFQKLEEGELINLIENKLRNSNISFKHHNLRQSAKDILCYIKNNKGSLSYLKGSKLVLKFINTMKIYLELH